MLHKAFSQKRIVLVMVFAMIFSLISAMGSGIGSVHASGVQYTSVDAGGTHTLALDDKGNVWAWGKNSEGELGTGNITSSNVPKKLVVTDGGAPVQFVAVSAGTQHSVALDTNGNVWAWGFNGKGAIGTESATANVLLPVKASITGVKAIAAGAHYTLALKSDGTVWAWGNNQNGTLGVDLGITNPFLNNTSTPMQVKYANGAELVPLTAKYIAAGDNQSLAIDTNDVLWSWGLNGATDIVNQLPSKVLNGSGNEFKAKAVSAGNTFYAAVDLTGNVWTSGSNYGGTLGIGNADNDYVVDGPVKVTGVSNVTNIATGYAHVIVMDSTKKVWAWGLNLYSQLGNKSSTDANAPVQVKNNNGTFFVGPSSITAGGSYINSFTVAIKGGKLISWGANDNKQLLNTDDTLVSSAASKNYAEVKDVYTVTFNPQGGSAVSPITNVVSGNKITAPTPPTKTNYFFGGWYMESTYATQWDFSVDTVTAADITLYAKWTAYTVTYDGNGSTGGTVPTDSNYYIQGATATVQGNTGSLTRTNYTFAGWNTKADGTGTTYAANATYTIGAAHVVLYAKWTPTYTVTYVGNGSTGGSVPTDSGNYLQGATVSVKGNTGGLTFEGKAFAGWNTNADGTGTSYAASATFPMATANVVLYAQWVTGFSVTYDGNGNTGGSVPIDSLMYAPGDLLFTKAIGTLVRTKHRFFKWNTKADGTGTGYVVGGGFPIETANLVLYATWTPLYTVTYDGNGKTGGSVPTDSRLYAQGETVTAPQNIDSFTRKNYKFLGWNTEADGSGTSYVFPDRFPIGTADVVLYAQWTPAYIVTYNGNGNTGGSPPAASALTVPGGTVKIPGNNLTLTNYSFNNWNTKADGTGTIYKQSDSLIMGNENVDLYAQWAPTYTVTYKGNGNTSGSVPIDYQYYVPGATVTVKTIGNLARANFTFVSWNTEPDGSGTDYIAGVAPPLKMGTANVVLYAKWSPYEVKYNGNGSTGGSVPVDSGTYAPGATVSVLDNTGNLVRTRYTFDGWNTKANGTGTSYTASATFPMGTANVVLYAQWIVDPTVPADPTYTVTYDDNGNTGGSVPTDSGAYEEGATVTVVGNTGNLERTNYTFAGWNTKADGTGPNYTAGATFPMGTADVVLYAKWTANAADPTYTVTYNGNGSTGGVVPVDSGSYVQGATVTVVGNIGNLERTNYTFNGWNTKADGTGPNYAAGATFPMGTTNVVLYAKWTANGVDPTYTVTYNGNGSTGGSVPTDNGSYVQGATVTVVGNTGNLERTNYTFAGWNTKADGTDPNYAASATFPMGTTNVVLYAKWTANGTDPTYTVTYNGNGSTGGAVPVDSGSYVQGATVTVVGNTGNLERTNYTFAGWNTKADGTGPNYTASATFPMGTADVVLYAKWTANGADPTYTVTYNGNGSTGGSVPTDSGSYVQGATVTVQGNTGSLSRVNHTFAGWNTKADGTGPSYAASATFPMGTADVVLYARWTANATNPGGGPSTPPANTTETITVDVAAGDKGVVSKTQITRTTNSDGTKSDHVTLLPNKATESVDKTKAAGADTVRILIPDAKDEVKEVRVDLPPQAIKTVADSGLDLQIYTDNGAITIPNNSLQNMNPDLFFRVVPIKKESERKEVEERAKQEQVVRVALGDGSVKIVGRPMTIETNMSSREARITLPMDRALIPQDAKAKETFLANLVIFIEHSDGEKVLVRPELGDYPDGRLALTFTIQKFSTFTTLNMDNWAKYIAGGNTETKASHKGYINGYPDHTFRPANSIKRAEMAAILSRVVEIPQANAVITYPDVSLKYWAYDEISQASQTGLMIGYKAGIFKPEGAITRAEMAAIITRWMKLSGTPNQSFTDVHVHWAEQAIAQVSQAGYMTGYPDGSFQPDRELTRAEAVAVINRVLVRGPLYGTTKTWSDVANNYWALHEIEEASQNHTYTVRPEGGEQKTE